MLNLTSSGMNIPEPTKKSKPKNEVDFFDKLPEPILHLIFSGLTTTEDAFRASLLSRRWRDLWTSVSSLDIDCNRRLKPSSNFDKDKFKEFVDCVLVNNTLELESVRLSCGYHYNMSTVGEWIQAAVIRKVKSLDLSFSLGERFYDLADFPRCLIQCDSLEVLRLNLHNSAIYLYGGNIFPALRVLELNNVELLADAVNVNMFFNSCPLLEELSLIDCFPHLLVYLYLSSPTLKTLRIDDRKVDYEMTDGGYHGLSRLQISCPKLMVLEYTGFTTYDLFSENLESLKKAVIHPEPVGRQDIPHYISFLGEYICKLFAGVSHVKSLSLNLYFIQAIIAARDSDEAFPASLPNLKTLEISTTVDDYTMKVVMRILKCSPKLESLYLTLEKEIFKPDLWELDEAVARHLKKVEFLEFSGEKRKLDMARFLLEHGHELEEMVFSWRDKVSYHEKSMDTLKEVSKFLDSKASSTVKLITLLKE